LAQASSGPAALRDLGEHPAGGKVEIYSGRYGPYVQHGKIRATLPRSQTPETLTLQDAIELLAQKAAKEAPAKTPGKKTAKAKTAAARKKPAGKKKAA